MEKKKETEGEQKNITITQNDDDNDDDDDDDDDDHNDDKVVLEPQVSPENTSKYVDTVTFLNLNQRSLTPR